MVIMNLSVFVVAVLDAAYAHSCFLVCPLLFYFRSFDIYQAPHLLHVITVKVHNKIINCLSWCPVSEQHGMVVCSYEACTRLGKH